MVRASLVLALALVIWSPAQAQTTELVTGKMMMERCQEMQAQKQKMMAEMKAQDAALTEQVAKMNSAPADKKTDLMAAVLTQMVEQQTAMHARMEKMQTKMMQHMTEHMQMGKDSMAQCPMMKSADDKPVSSPKAD
jgi:hypothetical protein